MSLEEKIQALDYDDMITIYSTKEGNHVREESPDIYRMDVSYFKDEEEIFRYWAFREDENNYDNLESLQEIDLPQLETESVTLEDESKGKWVTINGSHKFIKDGEKLVLGEDHNINRCPKCGEHFHTNKHEDAKTSFVKHLSDHGYKSNQIDDIMKGYYGDSPKDLDKEFPVKEMLVQESEWNEGDHPRDKDGKWTEKGGGENKDAEDWYKHLGRDDKEDIDDNVSQGFSHEQSYQHHVLHQHIDGLSNLGDGGEAEWHKTRGRTPDHIDTPEIPDTLSNPQKILKQKYADKYQQYAQFDEMNGDIKTQEPIHDSPEPTDYHRATAYTVLQNYPDMDENFLIKQSWKADKIRAKHLKGFDENLSKLQNTLITMPDVTVHGRIKGRFKMLDKLGRKSAKYPDVDKMRDVSGFRVIIPNFESAEEVMKLMKASNLNIKETMDFRNAPLDGYRAIHFDILNSDGTMSEFQVKTPNEEKWANHFHDTLYKYDKNTQQGKQIEENLPDLMDYSLLMSDYFYSLDTGITNIEKPQCPEPAMRIIGCL